jgi:hypothetical protein
VPQPRSRIVVVGKTGTGKSTAVKDALRGWQSRGVKAVALDPCDEYSRHGRPSGLIQLGPLRHRCTAAELAKKPSRLLDPRLSLAVVPDARTPHAQARAFLLVERLARAAGSMLLVLDEVGVWTDSTFGPATTQAGRVLAALAQNGRHDGLALVLIAQRASSIPKSARAQATDIWAFRQDEPSDVAALAERIGDEQAGQVSRLPVGQSIEWRDTTTTNTTTPALKVVGD